MALIRINLIPAEELEDKYWWFPDVLIFAVTLTLTTFCVEFYLDITRDEIARLDEEREELVQNIQNLQRDLERYNNLQEKIEELKSTKDSLIQITKSKLKRYEQVIILEHIQNLKPEGVWLTKIIFGDPETDPNSPNPNPSSQGEIITLMGKALNNIVLAEFMTMIKSTQNQEVEKSNLRSQIYFSTINLQTANQEEESVGEDETVLNLMTFTIIISSSTREDIGGDKEAVSRRIFKKKIEHF